MHVNYITINIPHYQPVGSKTSFYFKFLKSTTPMITIVLIFTNATCLNFKKPIFSFLSCNNLMGLSKVLFFFPFFKKIFRIVVSFFHFLTLNLSIHDRCFFLSPLSFYFFNSIPHSTQLSLLFLNFVFTKYQIRHHRTI